VETPKPDGERETAYRERNIPFLVKRLAKRLTDLHPPHEAALIRRAADAVESLNEEKLDAPLLSAETLAALRACADALDRPNQGAGAGAGAGAGSEGSSAGSGGKVGGGIASLTAADLTSLIAGGGGGLSGLSGEDGSSAASHPFGWEAAYRAAEELYPAYAKDRDATKALLSERDQLLAKLLRLQEEHATGEAFYPDANVSLFCFVNGSGHGNRKEVMRQLARVRISRPYTHIIIITIIIISQGCLRLSAGHVEGYRAADAVEHSPVTTLAGLLDKHLEASLTGHSGGGDAVQGGGDFDCPPRLAEMISGGSGSTGATATAATAETPVCICYSTDTVGGNSGSPVLDSEGNFVAINFDRQRQGLMNEFKWSHDYSRSIGTDVRYILFLVGQYDGAAWLVDEMVN
jgi:hypothetical protein